MANTENNLKILVVDDSAVVRRIVREALDPEDDLEILMAQNGQIALETIERDAPDLVILDIEMPVLDGLETLKEIRARDRRLPVVMFSTLTERGAAVTLQALAGGAHDYVTKPSGSANVTAAKESIRTELLSRVRGLCRRRKVQPDALPSRSVEPKVEKSSGTPAPPKPRVRPVAPPARIDVVAIASSTGGPAALAEVLPALPRDFPLPIVIVQHMPNLFTGLLAKSLDQKCELSVAEGIDGALVEPGKIWIAPGGLHMEVKRDGGEVRLVTHEGPPECMVRPAADVMYRSVAEAYGKNVLAVVLTGMGKDGLSGGKAIVEAGGRLIAQDEETSVVWGMPGFVAREGVAEAVLPLDEIALEIIRRATVSAGGRA